MKKGLIIGLSSVAALAIIGYATKGLWMPKKAESSKPQESADATTSELPTGDKSPIKAPITKLPTVNSRPLVKQVTQTPRAGARTDASANYSVTNDADYDGKMKLLGGVLYDMYSADNFTYYKAKGVNNANDYRMTKNVFANKFLPVSLSDLKLYVDLLSKSDRGEPKNLQQIKDLRAKYPTIFVSTSFDNYASAAPLFNFSGEKLNLQNI